MAANGPAQVPAVRNASSRRSFGAHQCHWVPSDLNPADIATKTSSFTSMHKWFDGPEYLLQERSRWPTCTDLGAPTNIEVKQVFFVATTPLDPIVNVEHFSDWRRLYRAVATFILYIEKLKATARKTPPITRINAKMIRRAQTTLIHYSPTISGNDGPGMDENLPRNTWPKGIVTEVVLAKNQQLKKTCPDYCEGPLHSPLCEYTCAASTGAPPKK
ncbi:uncharacterized protein [Drosophila suzukii]|uniref:Uncharacterized protein n=1 Tax=Drosophila suzukii TaxID=28584 RepID=A0ABM4TXF8_DROSZ